MIKTYREPDRIRGNRRGEEKRGRKKRVYSGGGRKGKREGRECGGVGADSGMLKVGRERGVEKTERIKVSPNLRRARWSSPDSDSTIRILLDSTHNSNNNLYRIIKVYLGSIR